MGNFVLSPYYYYYRGMIMKTVKKILLSKIYVWIVLATAVFFAFGYAKGVFRSNEGDVQSSSVVQYVKDAEEVVFLNAGIEKIVSKENNTNVFGLFNLPASQKKSIIVLKYIAKFGIKSAPKITSNGEHKYTITLPKYEVIGIELNKTQPYELYDTSGGLLSLSTEDVDTGELVSKGLSTKEQTKYLKAYVKDITASAKNYYATLLKGVDPDIELTFKTTN